ncbi:MAG: hypothetical protein DME99_05600 [Verrucomicrobia bacterium]|nr:MAG: hypothetical protein DME99_05600 [Verrucomicrobiota bacterium]
MKHRKSARGVLLVRARRVKHRKSARRILLVRALTFACLQLAPVPLHQRRGYKSGLDGGRRRPLEDGLQIGVNSTHHMKNRTNLADFGRAKKLTFG